MSIQITCVTTSTKGIHAKKITKTHKYKSHQYKFFCLSQLLIRVAPICMNWRFACVCCWRKKKYIVKLAYLLLSVLPREAEHSAGWFYCFSRRKAAWTELHSFALKDCKHFFAVTSRTATLACSLQCSRVVGKVSTAQACSFFYLEYRDSALHALESTKGFPSLHLCIIHTDMS